MPRLYNVEITDFYDDDRACCSYPGQIRLEQNNIFLSYIHEEIEFNFQGSENGEGHYLLHGINNTEYKATLHRFNNSNIFEGYFYINDEKGMWRLKIQKD